ncbi:hypothetical protein MKEN_00935100 [Mycena kentingensis (nom. inval.)]|nr:hypothetical protein MKEN_00935100 [Mycena kentingensis (nom. inval.)]
MSSNEPPLPLELVLNILELLADDLLPGELSRLLCLSKVVHKSLEPFLYREIDFETGSLAHISAFLAAAESKSPDFLRRSVRRVSLVKDDSYGHDWHRVFDALQKCTNVQGLAAYVDLPVSAEFMSALDRMAPRRLALYFSIIKIDDLRNCHGLRAITHLEALEQDLEPEHLKFIVALPALTHLAVNYEMDAQEMEVILQRPTLQLLVFLLAPASRENLGLVAPANFANDLPVRDPRVVVTVYSEWTECTWVCKKSYWEAAERFVAQKRLGLIEKDRFWTGNFHQRESIDEYEFVLP